MSNSFFDDDSRVDKYSKRRKNTKLINSLIILAVLLGVFLAFTWIFDDEEEQATTDSVNEQENEASSSGEEAEEATSEPSETEDENNQSEDSTVENEDESTNTSEESAEQNNENEDLPETSSENISTSEDPNVLRVIERDWQPIGTEQEEPHTTTYEKGTVDWEEMWRAAAYGAGLSEGDTINWWVTNGGDPQRVVTTISDKAETQTYRVYLQWVANEGWQPTKVEELKENDQKDRFANDEGEQDDQANQNDVNTEEQTEQQESGE
ncbi:YrrS family protein [Salinibacillus xinjiangensis]|uniref:YrrS family protein n=1 Tax=Salinibacillus xinjiangensis TaxID=1229268 RepID=UPI0018913309|nr:YrrS family protein [Salinibacillus xinjiangensis]